MTLLPRKQSACVVYAKFIKILLLQAMLLQLLGIQILQWEATLTSCIHLLTWGRQFDEVQPEAEHELSHADQKWTRNPDNWTKNT